MKSTSILTQKNDVKTFLILIDHCLESDLAITSVFAHVAQRYYQMSIKGNPEAKRDRLTWHDFAEALYLQDGLKCLFREFALYRVRVIPLSSHLIEPNSYLDLLTI